MPVALHQVFHAIPLNLELRPGDVPVFWACGVTPQTALAAAGLPLAVTHAPGHMFVCDLRDDDLRV